MHFPDLWEPGRVLPIGALPPALPLPSTRPPETKRQRVFTNPDLLIFEAELAIEGMEQLTDAMADAEPLMKQAEREHWLEFEKQMQELTGIEEVEMEEPYLEGLLAEAQLNFVQAIARNIDPLNAFVTTALSDAEALITGATDQVIVDVKAAPMPIPLSLKAIDFDKNLEAQVRELIRKDADKVKEKLEIRLSMRRQKEFGLTHYTWVTAGDEKVRPSHAANEGATFSWDNPPSTGHPGTAPNCRCFPYPALVDDQGVEQLRRPGPGSDGRAESLYPEQYLIPAIAARRGAGAAVAGAKQGVEAIKNIPRQSDKKPLSNDKTTSHGIKRGLERKISQKEIDKAIKSAEKSKRVEIKIGKYGTKQKHYTGDNGVVVVVETEGRNTGKVITTWRKK